MTEPFGQPLTYARYGIKSIATERFSHHVIAKEQGRCRSRQQAHLKRRKVPNGAKFSTARVLYSLLRASTPRAWAKSLGSQAFRRERFTCISTARNASSKKSSMGNAGPKQNKCLPSIPTITTWKPC